MHGLLDSIAVIRNRFMSTPSSGEEFVVLDSAGRMQLPRAHIDALGLAHRVRLRLEDDHVGVWPDRVPRSAGPSADAAAPDAEEREHG